MPVSVDEVAPHEAESVLNTDADHPRLVPVFPQKNHREFRVVRLVLDVALCLLQVAEDGVGLPSLDLYMSLREGSQEVLVYPPRGTFALSSEPVVATLIPGVSLPFRPLGV